MVSIKHLIDNKDYHGLRQVLISHPELANEGIPYDENSAWKAHPLHRICDGVFSATYTDAEAVEIARIFLEYGANVNGNEFAEKKDTPLIAAASLHADQVAMLYLENGADIHHAGCHGGTALHWAAWCGRDSLVERLINEGAEINRRCIDFRSTPLFWAVHGLKSGGAINTRYQVDCARLLLEAGADKTIPNAEGTMVVDLLDEEDWELRKMFSVDRFMG